MSRWKRNSSFTLWLVALLFCSAVSTSNGQQVGTSCTSPRVRKSWDAFDASEKKLYLDAVALAMDKGFYTKFIQIHTDSVSGNEAHQNCMFIYWHRMLLLGYENMLRSLDPKYQCVTIPVWDHLSNTARAVASGVTSSGINLERFSSIITDTGGTSNGLSKSLSIYGTTISYSSTIKCVGKYPLSQFCGNNSVCARCMMRTQNTTASYIYPAEASFSSVYQQIFSYDDLTNFVNQVERGVHNTVHNAVSGIMAYFQAPADPIFFSHHALIDVLQTIYLKCQNGGDGVFLSADTKSSDPRFWQSCVRKDKVNYYTTSDTVTMRVLANNGASYVNVWQDPNNMLYPFFKDLPNKYTDYVDAKDMGNYSYTYNISGALANMYTNCKDSNTIDATSSIQPSFMAEPSQESEDTYDGDLEPIIQPGTVNDDIVKRWNIVLYESARIVGYEEWAARDQVEMIRCQYQADCLGGVADFSDLYRKNFGITGHTRCFTIIEDLKAGDRIIGIPDWKGITNRFLSCAKYQKKEVVSSFAKAVDQMQKSIS
ncbi:hypothetical protein BBO99_00006409 [Phytophthora kernoviae]|uniref:Tyrosinase copper-binding domain-containing protein n=2 Tax=Phytophthora kernoviae TaxID=325452 RepID=A0A421GKS4_9STRA|nr:hypothetical protein G195_008427 [Phytophthora kernoviae 00238/432]KAG2519700.1 hypothetical protein JM16_007035 [Phytophthora kernoviae]KAG2520673.1 hypothetical protein JM18_006996 [Phytophthora kernoviae]RLN13952.1 hypothetical protein BBI17_006399 [Phytophthora kernoviae]RLN77861.1 hypothetical protein BBO99_00006409 [Phytophthora kernoviae]